MIFKEFEQEFPGILNWAIEGYRKYQSEGVEEPKVVLDAIKEYRNDSDTVGRFIEECCTTSNKSISTKDFFIAYQSWCNTTSEDKQFNRLNGLTKELKRKGFKIRSGHAGKSFLVGFELYHVEEPTADRLDDF